MIINFLLQSEALRKLIFNHNSDINEDNIFSYSSSELERLLKEAIDDNPNIYSSDIIFDNDKFSLFQFSNTSKDTSGNETILNVLNDLLEVDDVQKIVDVDADGTLSTEEIDNFYKTMKSFDENPDDISMNDIYSTIQSINNGEFRNILSDFESISDAQTNDLQTENIANQQGQSYSSSNNNGYTNSANNIPTNSNPQTLDNMSLEELEAQKTQQESAVQTAQQKLQAAYSGETEAIQTAQSDYDEKKQAYEDALSNDENIPDELLSEQQSNLSAIENQKTVISGIESNISSKESEITSQKTTVSADEANINSLEASISKLEAQTSEDESIQADIASKLATAKDRLETAKAKLTNDKNTLSRLEQEKATFETDLETKKTELTNLETQKEEIEAKILANCNEATKLALEGFKQAETNLETVKTNEIEAAKTEQTNAQTKLDEINAAIETKKAKETKREFSVFDINNAQELYEAMGLDEKGLNFEVFASALEGYNNLENRENDYLGIFDTTQGDNANRYYLLDLSTFELIGQCQLKVGSGNMDDVTRANQEGSHATLSGFEKVGNEYYSSSMEKNALRLIGLEEGINDNALEKGTVVHYTTGNHTWGCKGFPPIKTNGKIDLDATYEYMRKMFPTGAIIYTHPTDEDYWELSELY